MKNRFAFPAAFLAVLLCMPPAAQGQIDQTQPVPALQTTAAALPQGLNSSQTGSPYPAAAPGSLTFDVVVIDKSGAAVSGLQPADFKLFDNSQPQSIVSLRAVNGMKVKADPPVEVILLIDAVNAPPQTITMERQWLVEFFKENGGELALPTSFVILTDKGLNYQNRPARDGKVLQAFLDANIPGLRNTRPSEKLQGAVEREQASLKALNLLALQLSKRPGRKLLIWLSYGWSVISNPAWIGGEKDRQAIYGSITSLSTALRKARITLYCISPFGGYGRDENYTKYLKGVDDPNHADMGDLLLPVIATQTGGQVPYEGNDLAIVIDRCIKDARSFYVLTFNPPKPAHPDEYHALQVEIAKPGLKARTRTGYYADPVVPETQSLPTASLQTVQEVKE
ncbi:MAG TPA: VWA domain-containing protein [Terracidiphilus sp.]|nr:VWA domain-containing protein [Terracidiphilus sp.]